MTSKSPVWDMTLSWNSWFRDEITLPRFKQAGVDVIGLTIGGGNGGRVAAIEGIKAVNCMVEKNSDKLLIARTINDIQLAKQEGKLAIELNFQGSEVLDGKEEDVHEFYEMGIRHMGIVWNSQNLVGSSSTHGPDTGLTDFGRRVIKEMNKAGMIVDGTHASYRTSLEAIECCEAPFIFSHGNIDALASSYKNLKDDQIKACASVDGVIGISGFGTYMDDLSASAEAMFRQIHYVCEIVGPRHVGLGLDFLRQPQLLWEKVQAHPEKWPGVRESEFFPPEKIYLLTNLMSLAGYSLEDIDGILGENWLRISSACWK